MGSAKAFLVKQRSTNLDDLEPKKKYMEFIA